MEAGESAIGGPAIRGELRTEGLVSAEEAEAPQMRFATRRQLQL